MNKGNTVKRLADAAGKKYGGVLRNWEDTTFFGYRAIVGDLDNRTVRTSEVVWVEADFDYVETQNSFYVLDNT